MTDEPIERPDGWQRRSAEERDPHAVDAWAQEAENGAAYVVSIHRGDGDVYELELATIDPRDHPVRHDYYVADYDTRETAYGAAEDLLAHLDAELDAGALSLERPTVEATEAVIATFTGESAGLIDRLLDRFSV